MSNLLKTELYKLFHSWYFWGIGIFNLLLSSILLLDSKERSSNLIMASLYNIPLLYFLSIVFIALFIGSDFSGRTLNTYITAGHKRSSIFRVKLIVSQIGCIIILVFPLFVHGIISQFYIGEKLFWNDSTYTMVLLTLFAMITLCALPMFFAFIFRDMGKTLTVSMVLFFVMIFLLNSESAQIISRIIPMLIPFITIIITRISSTTMEINSRNTIRINNITADSSSPSSRIIRISLITVDSLSLLSVLLSEADTADSPPLKKEKRKNAKAFSEELFQELFYRFLLFFCFFSESIRAFH